MLQRACESYAGCIAGVFQPLYRVSCNGIYVAIIVTRWRRASHVYHAKRNSRLGIFSVTYDEITRVASFFETYVLPRRYISAFPAYSAANGEILMTHEDIYKFENLSAEAYLLAPCQWDRAPSRRREKQSGSVIKILLLSRFSERRDNASAKNRFVNE